MPILNREERRAYNRAWMGRRRSEWIAANGPCKHCGGTDRLEVDHIDPHQKISHRVWSWTLEKRAAELAKCQVLCRSCHQAKSIQDARVRPRIARQAPPQPPPRTPRERMLERLRAYYLRGVKGARGDWNRALTEAEPGVWT